MGPSTVKRRIAAALAAHNLALSTPLARLSEKFSQFSNSFPFN